LIGFTPLDEKAGFILQEVYKILKRFFIRFEFGMVAAAIHGKVDCVDYISHLNPFKVCRPLAIICFRRVPQIFNCRSYRD
jgi:hypothetical protein